MNVMMLLAVLASAAEMPKTQAGTPTETPPPYTAPAYSNASTLAQYQSAAEPDIPIKTKHFGALLDVGVPDGVGISALYSPWYFVRAHAGVMSLWYATGIRAGITLTPFDYWINPTLSGEYGHFFRSDLTSLIPSNADKFLKAAVSAVSADYFSAHLGLEFGRPQHFQFYVRGGISTLTTDLPNFATKFRQLSTNPNLEVSNPSLHAVTPSAKLGFLLYFL